MSEALDYLLKLVDEGVEYPDAEYKAATRFSVPASDLRTDYDLHHSRPNYKAQPYQEEALKALSTSECAEVRFRREKPTLAYGDVNLGEISDLVLVLKSKGMGTTEMVQFDGRRRLKAALVVTALAQAGRTAYLSPDQPPKAKAEQRRKALLGRKARW